MSDNINDTRKAYIAGIGMITSIGADTEMTAIAMDAEYSGYRASEYNLNPASNFRDRYSPQFDR